MSSSNTAEILIKQGKDTLERGKDLMNKGKKNGKERSDLFEKYCANEHSFRVYTYMDKELGQSSTVQDFMDALQAFGENFTGVNTDLETTVDVQAAKEAYQKAMDAYNDMAQQLG